MTLTRAADAIRSLMWPRSVAIVGADPDATKMNGAPVHNLLDFGFSGRIYPVTPHFSDLHGIPCHPDLRSIGAEIDTVVIAVKADRALQWLDEAGSLGIRSATIISAGFSEGAAKDTGDALTAELQAIVARHGIRVLGPNTAGLINLRHNYVPRGALNHFGPDQTVTGNTAIICQSGAISNILYNKCQANGVGVAYSLATGDQLDLDVWDFIEAALDDAAVGQILCVVEGFRDAARFAATASRAAAARKPIILLKLGRSDAGARMVATHSGSMAGSYAAFRAVAAQTGIIEAADFDAFWEMAALFSAWGTRAAAGADRAPRLGAFAISGGDAAFIADEAAGSSLEMPPSSEAFNAYIDRSFAFAAGGNPFDCTGEVLGKTSLLRDSAHAFATQNDFDYLLFAAPVFRSELAVKLYPQLVDGIRSGGGRAAVSAWAAGSLTETGIGIFRTAGLPVFEHSGRAIRAIEAYDQWSRHAGAGVELVFADPARTRPDPFYAELKEELSRAGVAFGPGWHLKLPAETAMLPEAGSGPYVLKLNCRTQLHKSAAGLVRLGIGSTDALRRAMAGIPRSAEHDGFVLEQQLRSDMELYVGGTTDPDFGKLLIAGFGGRFAEHLGGRGIWLGAGGGSGLRRWLAATPAGSALLSIDPPLFDELSRLVEAAARWFMTAADVRAFDLNPVLVDLAGRRICAVDCRIS